MHAEDCPTPCDPSRQVPDAPDQPCVFPPLVAVWTEAHLHFRQAQHLAHLVTRDIKAGDVAILGEGDDARAVLVDLYESAGDWAVVDTVLNSSPTEAIAAAELGGVEAVEDDRTEELPQAGGSVLQAMGAANNFVDLFDQVRDCALGAIVWHNIGRPDPWDGSEPELLALWTQFTNTACRKGPYAACRTFSVLPPNDGWPDFTGEPDPTPPAPTEQHMPLNSSPPAPPV